MKPKTNVEKRAKNRHPNVPISCASIYAPPMASRVVRTRGKTQHVLTPIIVNWTFNNSDISAVNQPYNVIETTKCVAMDAYSC